MHSATCSTGLPEAVAPPYSEGEHSGTSRIKASRLLVSVSAAKGFLSTAVQREDLIAKYQPLWMLHARTTCHMHCILAGIHVSRQVTGGLTDTLSPSAQTLTRALLEVILSVWESMQAELLLESLSTQTGHTLPLGGGSFKASSRSGNRKARVLRGRWIRWLMRS